MVDFRLRKTPQLGLGPAGASVASDVVVGFDRDGQWSAVAAMNVLASSRAPWKRQTDRPRTAGVLCNRVDHTLQNHREHGRQADFMYSCQASAKHFEQCAEFLPFRNRGLGPLSVTVLRASPPVHLSSSF